MSLHSFETSSQNSIVAELHQNVGEASSLLKAIAHEGRLMILSKLSESEASVSELEDLLDARQAAVSQQLARLRQEGLVKTRRSGKAIYYSLADDRVRDIIHAVHGTFGKH
jgi:DNA-binding transcriptional ArsR family regulator